MVRHQVEQRQLPELPPSPGGQALHRLGFVLKRPRKRLVKADEAKREAFVAGYAVVVDKARRSGGKSSLLTRPTSGLMLNCGASGC